jgi:hypothetical protein
VGFNLGSACQLLSNVCILYRKCYNFNTACGAVGFFKNHRKVYSKDRDPTKIILGKNFVLYLVHVTVLSYKL